MAFWSFILLLLWGFLLFAGAMPAIEKFLQTPDDPSRHQVVMYKDGVQYVRPATTSDMMKEKYLGVTCLIFFGVVGGAAGFLFVTSLIDYRTRFLGWSIKQLPKLLDNR